MSNTTFYNGILYQIEYQPQLSNNDYTQHKVYYIKTDKENYPCAKKDIISLMERELGYKQGYLWSEGEYELANALHPSIINALHQYYEFTYEEDLNVFVYTLVIPYDD